MLHKFHDHVVNAETEILILGTFNPDVPNGPDFFYGRPRNYLWQLLPGCWELPSLKGSPLADKMDFMSKYKIDFADLIHSVDVPEGQENNVNDIFIDPLVGEWKDVIGLMQQLKSLKAVYFTRSTFGEIPNIHNRIVEIALHCQQNEIRFCLLVTPARFYNAEKQQRWIDTIITQVKCPIA